MGDRCNIVIRSNPMSASMSLSEIVKDGSVVFYGHWAGADMPFRLKEALGKKARWSDSAYLGRIIFDEFTQDHHGEETGFGISAYISDNNNPVMVVDVPARKVHMYKEGSVYADKSWSFEEYVSLSPEELLNTYSS